MAASVALLQDKLRRAAQAGDESGNGQALGTLTSTPPATDSATATADPDASDNGSNGSVSSSTVVVCTFQKQTQAQLNISRPLSSFSLPFWLSSSPSTSSGRLARNTRIPSTYLPSFSRDAGKNGIYNQADTVSRVPRTMLTPPDIPRRGPRRHSP